MFERARLLLTASYAAALGITLAGVGAVSYLLIEDNLNAEVDRSLAAALDSLDPRTTTRPVPVASEVPAREGTDGHETQEHERERLAPLPSDVFYIAFDASGVVGANPRLVNLAGVDLAAVAARAAGQPVQEVQGDHAHYRLAVRALEGGRYLAVGRSLRLVDRQLETLRTVFLVGGGAGLALSLISGFWLAGRTLRPIRQALESQRQFVSDASHELRTPIAVAKANAALLLADPESSIETHIDQAEAVATELDHLSVLVGDLTTLARADEGRAALLFETVDLGELTGEVTRDMGALADVLGVALRCVTQPVRVRGDRARLRQLVVILLDNSLKYADQGGNVYVRCAPEGSRAELTVTDDGAGISPQDQKRIFQRFYRADSERTRARGGTGLGLAIGKWIVEAHGGRIVVESQPGQGTTFRVRLPLA